MIGQTRIAKQLASFVELVLCLAVEHSGFRTAAIKVAPRIAPGGIMIFEDAGHTPPLGGARLAVADFLESDAGRHFVPIYMQSGQMFLVRYQQ